MVAFPEGTTKLQMSLKFFSHGVLQMWYEVSINQSVKISFKTRYQTNLKLQGTQIQIHKQFLPEETDSMTDLHAKSQFIKLF